MNCPKLYNVSCSSERTYTHEFYDRSSRSRFSTVCSAWSLETVRNLTVPEDGTLKIRLHFLSNFQLSLPLVLQLHHRDERNVTLTHSRKHIKFEEIPNSSCQKMVEISFHYVYSGFYELDVNDKRCFSKLFYVDSLYKKDLISHSPPMTSLRYLSQSRSLKYTFVNDGISRSASVHVALYNSHTCNGLYLLVDTHLTYVDKGNCCHSVLRESDIPCILKCPCRWENDKTLICNYRDIENGSYCLLLEYIDPRCENNTLWTVCRWISFKEANGSVAKAVDADTAKGRMPLCLILSGVSILLVALVIAVIKLRSCLLRPGVSAALVDNSGLECSSYEKYDILFLYPRDCVPLMGAMAHFRALLKHSCSGKVYDPWDEDVFDEVATSIETWSLPLIQNDKVKIVLLLSECSKILEEAYLDGECSVRYRQPKALDTVFGQSIKAINQYFALRSDSYQRVFVVRLDEASVLNQSFYLNRATVYTIPTLLHQLIIDLTSDYSLELDRQHYDFLEDAICVYREFRNTHKNYLKEILEIKSSKINYENISDNNLREMVLIKN